MLALVNGFLSSFRAYAGGFPLFWAVLFSLLGEFCEPLFCSCCLACLVRWLFWHLLESGSSWRCLALGFFAFLLILYYGSEVFQSNPFSWWLVLILFKVLRFAGNDYGVSGGNSRLQLCCFVYYGLCRLCLLYVGNHHIILFNILSVGYFLILDASIIAISIWLRSVHMAESIHIFLWIVNLAYYPRIVLPYTHYHHLFLLLPSCLWFGLAGLCLSLRIFRCFASLFIPEVSSLFRELSCCYFIITWTVLPWLFWFLFFLLAGILFLDAGAHMVDSKLIKAFSFSFWVLWLLHHRMYLGFFL